jgi:hypothetical protein
VQETSFVVATAAEAAKQIFGLKMSDERITRIVDGNGRWISEEEVELLAARE